MLPLATKSIAKPLTNPDPPNDIQASLSSYANDLAFGPIE